MKTFFASTMNRFRHAAAHIGTFTKNHKIMSGIIVLLILGLGYWGISALAKGNAATMYSLAPVTEGELAVTITDSGTVSAEHQLSLSPKASGTITSINAVAGQQVRAGTIIATIDASDANDSVTSARQNVESAQISYQQAITSSNTSITGDQNTLRTSLTTASNAVTTTFTQLPTIVTGIDGVLHNLSTLPGYTAEKNLEAYSNYINTVEAHTQHDKIASEYQSSLSAYQSTQNAYASYDVTNATADQTISILNSTLSALQTENQLLRDTLTFLNYINSQVIGAGHVVPADLTSQISTVTGYINTVSSDITSIQSAKTSLTNAQASLSSDTQSLNGSSMSLSVQSAQLNLQKAQQALAQAERTEEDYIVRAPFDGTIASVAVKKYDPASSGTAVAVLITKENYVTLSVNEADAAAIAVGQKASITFDAIDNLTVDGTVAEVDQVGTVSQGVATYTVKVGFDSQDSRIKPGMTAEATITTADAADAIQVPAAAVHTSGNASYVEVATMTGTSTQAVGANRQFGNGTSTPRFRMASSTFAGGGAASSTFGGGRTFASRALSVPASSVKITRIPVTLGISNDTMVQITSGLHRGQLVVTGTTSGTAKSGTSSTGSIFGLFGGAARRPATGAAGAAGVGGARTFQGGGGNATFRAGPVGG